MRRRKPDRSRYKNNEVNYHGYHYDGVKVYFISVTKGTIIQEKCGAYEWAYIDLSRFLRDSTRTYAEISDRIVSRLKFAKSPLGKILLGRMYGTV